MARALALALTGHEKETGLVRYTALALLFTSWQFDCGSGFDAYMLALHEVPADEGALLLDKLSSPSSYTRNAIGPSATKTMLRELHKIALEWKTSLVRPGLNVLRLHVRTLAMLDFIASIESTATKTLDQEQSLAAITRVISDYSPAGAGIARANDADVLGFQSAVAALDWMQKKAGARAGIAFPENPRSPSPEYTSPSELGAMGYPVFEPLTARNALNRPSAMVTAKGEGNSQLRVLLESMAQNTGYRGVSEVPAGSPLDELYSRFPHFTEVLDFVSNCLALAGCGEEGKAVRFSPILLRGMPGTGKTFFAQELSRVLGASFVERDLSVTSDAFVLTGLDSGFKNSKPGLIFDALVSGTKANPVICLNEVEKAHQGGTHSSPLASLYSLLEPTSARLFTDEFVPVPIDASRINWVLTANEGPLPDPILSRLEQFNIAAPTPSQCRLIAGSVWEEVRLKHMPRGHGFPDSLPDDVLDVMSKTSPRIMRKALTLAAGVAAKSGRKYLEVVDVLNGFRRDHEQGHSRSIGFTAKH